MRQFDDITKKLNIRIISRMQKFETIFRMLISYG